MYFFYTKKMETLLLYKHIIKIVYVRRGQKNELTIDRFKITYVLLI